MDSLSLTVPQPENPAHEHSEDYSAPHNKSQESCAAHNELEKYRKDRGFTQRLFNVLATLGT